MTTFVLIQASEGYTESIFVVNGSRDELVGVIQKTVETFLTEEPESEWMKSNKDFIEKKRDTLISMIRKHQNWTPGRHRLENIEPHWQEWTLIVTEDEFGDFW